MGDVAVVKRPYCPRCRSESTVPLAREGDIQRLQCLTCTENFTAPAPPESPKAVPVPQDPPRNGVAHAVIAAPERPGGLPEPAKASCPKCGKPYYRVGKRYEDHVASCDGTSTQAPAPAVPEETKGAIRLSIMALRAQRSLLEGEIRSIDAAIRTLEGIR